MKYQTQPFNKFELGPVHRTTFENGAVFIHHKTVGFNGAFLGLWFLVGSRDEKPEQSGMAHLIEHLLFRSTDDQGKYTDRIEQLGGEINAFTSKEEMCFELSGIRTKLANMFPDFLEMVLKGNFTQEDLAKEKAIVIQELKEDLDDFDLFGQEMIFKHSFDFPLGHSVGGNPRIVKKASYKDVQKFHRKYISPERMVITVTSNDEHSDYIPLILQTFNRLGLSKSKKAVRPKLKTSIGKINSFQKSARRDCEMCSFQWTLPGVCLGSPERGSLNVLDSALTEGMSSVLFKALRENKALVYAVSSELNPYSDNGNLLVSLSCKHENLKEIKKILTTSFAQIAEQGLDPALLEQVKNYYKDYLILRLDDLVERNAHFAYNEIYRQKLVTIAEQQQLIEDVTNNSIKKVIKKVLKHGPSTFTVIPNKIRGENDSRKS